MLKEHIGDNLLRNAPYLVGSLQMLFDPVGLARSLRRGVVDFVRFPLEGLQRKSIVSFVSGLGYGSVAFLREISCTCSLVLRRVLYSYFVTIDGNRMIFCSMEHWGDDRIFSDNDQNDEDFFHSEEKQNCHGWSLSERL